MIPFYIGVKLWLGFQREIYASESARLDELTKPMDSHTWFIWKDIRSTYLLFACLPYMALELGVFDIVPPVPGFIVLFLFNFLVLQAYKRVIGFYR
jgi:hypothetical protein